MQPLAVLSAALLLGAALAPTAAHAQAATESSAATTDAAASDDEATAKAEAARAELYDLPEGATEQVAMEKLSKIQRAPAAANTREAVRANLTDMLAFTDKVLARDYSASALQNTAALKYSLYNALKQLGQDDALDERSKWLSTLTASDDKTRQSIGRTLLALEPVAALAFESKVDEARWKNAVQPSIDLVNGIATEGREPSQFELEAVMAISEMLDGTAPVSVSAPAFEAYAAAFGKSDNATLQMVSEMFAGTARRLTLPGSKMKIQGDTLDGKEFQLQRDLAGKVVLVDFWATWCGYCIEAFPEMKRVYEQYQDQGFEIVGVNLDDSRDVVDAYLKSDPLPWTNIQVLEGDGSEHPNAKRYAVSGIPFLVLVGRDGKVIRTQVAPQQIETLVKDALAAKAE